MMKKRYEDKRRGLGGEDGGDDEEGKSNDPIRISLSEPSSMTSLNNSLNQLEELQSDDDENMENPSQSILEHQLSILQQKQIKND